MFKPIGFNIKELVDEETFALLGEQAWRLFDIRFLITLERLKQYFGWTVIMNTWMFNNTKYNDATGASFTQRGYRTTKSAIGAKGGAHYLGLAGDLDAYDKNTGLRVIPDFARKSILDNIDKFEYIRCLEIDINWVHFDVMGCNDHSKRSALTSDKILLYSPSGNSQIITKS